MYNAFKSLKSKKFIIFIMVIQFSIGITMLNEVFGLVNVNNNKVKKFNDMVTGENTFLVKVNGGSNIYSYYGELEGIYEELQKEAKNMKGVLDIYMAYPSGVYTENYWDEEIASIYDNTNLSHVYLSDVIIDKRFFDRYKFEVVEGRKLEEADFDKDYKKENISVLLGNDYKDKVEIGQVFEKENVAWIDTNHLDDLEKARKFEKINFEVVGILEKEPIPIPSDFVENVAGSVVYSNAISVIPSVKNYMSYNAGEGFAENGVYIECNVGVEVDDIKKQIDSFLNKYCKDNNINANIYVEPIKINRHSLELGLSRNANHAKMLGGIIALLSLLGIMVTMIGDIKNRKKEFGIKISQGACVLDLCKEVLYEIGLLISISTIISWVYIINKYGIEAITIKTIIASTMLIVIATIVTALLPMYEVKRMKVINLLRGK